MRQTTLRPHDVAVALELALRPGEGYAQLAAAVGLSLSEAHGAVGRLAKARLVRTDERRVVPATLLDFLVAGVPHAFPAELGPETRGIPTAHSAAPLADELPSNDMVVWPSADGGWRGESLVPLYAGATKTPTSNPRLYELLALVDALRIGRARERARARELLRERLGTADRAGG